MAAAVEKTPSDKPSKSSGQLSASSASQDIKARLLEHLNAQRRPGQLVRVTEVGHHRFRVNWLSPVAPAGETTVTKSYRVAKSQFLLVEESNGELVITDKTVEKVAL